LDHVAQETHYKALNSPAFQLNQNLTKVATFSREAQPKSS
jgi:hypothetical protein